MMLFDQITQLVHDGSVVTFCEYGLDRHEKKTLSIRIEDAVVQEVIPPNKQLSRDELERIYGDNLDDIDYLQLSCLNCPRLVLGLGINDRGEMDVKVVVLNKDFYNTGLQTLDVTNEINTNNQEPNYILAQRGW